MKSEYKITDISVRAFTVPTDAPEADGTLHWESTSMVLVQLTSGEVRGIGYTYADPCTATMARKLLDKVVKGGDVMRHAELRQQMLAHIRNNGETGIAMMAVSAIDNALWDIRARILKVPLVHLLGQVRAGIPVYGSGGFTSYSSEKLSSQLGTWARDGLANVKMKIGTHPQQDPERVRVARKAIGPDCGLFVDANGAYTATQAIELAHRFQDEGVRWFEEPVSSDNLTGLSHVLERAPDGMDIAAGEYGYTAWYFRAMIDARAVSVLQADCTRCGGVSGFLDAASLAWAANLPLSSHCGPSMHLHVCCAVPRAVHMEFFHDHVRIERMFFDGFSEPIVGLMYPDLSRSGLGLDLKEADILRYEV